MSESSYNWEGGMEIDEQMVAIAQKTEEEQLDVKKQFKTTEAWTHRVFADENGDEILLHMDDK